MEEHAVIPTWESLLFLRSRVHALSYRGKHRSSPSKEDFPWSLPRIKALVQNSPKSVGIFPLTSVGIAPLTQWAWIGPLEILLQMWDWEVAHGVCVHTLICGGGKEVGGKVLRDLDGFNFFSPVLGNLKPLRKNITASNITLKKIWLIIKSVSLMLH